MTLSRPAKAVIAAFVLIAVLGYLIVVDVGLSAGRVHHGVRVQNIDLGGLTAEEVVEVIEERAEEIDDDPITLSAEGIDCLIYPFEVRWRARPFETTDAAIAVGREGAPFSALLERVRSWLGGVRVAWSDSADFTLMVGEVEECSEDFSSAGLEVAKVKLRYKIRRALVTWPRRTFRVPLKTT